jgi:hypothetical protein
MKHARDDYNRIQDPAGKIGEDEPVMLFRAQDRLMGEVLIKYLELLKQNGAKADIQQAVHEHINATLAWQRQHGCKTPDLPSDD